MYIKKHTHIIGNYNPSVRITAQLPISLMLCALILYVGGGTYSLTLTPNDRFLRNFCMAGLFALRVFGRNLLGGSRRRNIFHISFLMTDLGYQSRLLRLISRHTTYQTTATSYFMYKSTSFFYLILNLKYLRQLQFLFCCFKLRSIIFIKKF